MGLTCGTIQQIKTDNLDEVTRQFVGGSTRFKVLEPGVIEMRTDEKFRSVNQLFVIAQQKINGKIFKWAEETHGKGFGIGWQDGTIQQFYDRIIVRLKFPRKLEDSYLLEDELATLEEINRALADNVGNDFYMGDQALREQEEKESNNPVMNISEEALDSLMRYNKNLKC